MILKRLATLQMILLGGLGSVLFLPRDIRMQPSAVNLQLPELVSGWIGTDSPITQGERDILGPDTQFARKLYSNGADEIFVSVVLSGPDMNTSIHRPERCLPAQGLTIIDSQTVPVVDGPAPLQATRLHNIRSVQLSNGQPYTLHNIQYYWFVGSSVLTPSHYERAWIDLRDRVLKGQNQQWAYVTVSATITQGMRVFGRDEKQTDQMIRDFVKMLLPELQPTGTAAAP